MNYYLKAAYKDILKYNIKYNTPVFIFISNGVWLYRGRVWFGDRRRYETEVVE